MNKQLYSYSIKDSHNKLIYNDSIMAKSEKEAENRAWYIFWEKSNRSYNNEPVPVAVFIRTMKDNDYRCDVEPFVEPKKYVPTTELRNKEKPKQDEQQKFDFKNGFETSLDEALFS